MSYITRNTGRESVLGSMSEQNAGGTDLSGGRESIVCHTGRAANYTTLRVSKNVKADWYAHTLCNSTHTHCAQQDASPAQYDTD